MIYYKVWKIYKVVKLYHGLLESVEVNSRALSEVWIFKRAARTIFAQSSWLRWICFYSCRTTFIVMRVGVMTLIRIIETPKSSLLTTRSQL